MSEDPHNAVLNEANNGDHARGDSETNDENVLPQPPNKPVTDSGNPEQPSGDNVNVNPPVNVIFPENHLEERPNANIGTSANPNDAGSMPILPQINAEDSKGDDGLIDSLDTLTDSTQSTGSLSDSGSSNDSSSSDDSSDEGDGLAKQVVPKNQTTAVTDTKKSEDSSANDNSHPNNPVEKLNNPRADQLMSVSPPPIDSVNMEGNDELTHGSVNVEDALGNDNASLPSLKEEPNSDESPDHSDASDFTWDEQEDQASGSSSDDGKPCSSKSRVRRSKRVAKKDKSQVFRCVVTTDGFGRDRIVQILDDDSEMPNLIGDECLAIANYVGQKCHITRIKKPEKKDQKKK